MATFLLIGAVLLLAMLVAVAWAVRSRSSRWIVVALATAVLFNSMAHLLGVAWTGSYSPGVISSTVLWVPLGLITLAWAWRILPARSLAGGVAVGIVTHAIVLPLLIYGISQVDTVRT
jgi:hypothetical protein